MNLLMAPIGKKLEIVRVRQKGSVDRQEKFLSDLGFVIGASLTIVTENNGNLIVNIRDSRVALGKDLANRILVNIAE